MNVFGKFFTSEYSVGQRVIHIPTGIRGKVVDKQKQNGQSLISVEGDFGQKIVLEDRRLFQACERG